MGAVLGPMSDAAQQPLVSVVIAFLDPGEFLREAIESVFAQTYQHWELLLVDDGSRDGSTEIARRCADEHPRRVRYLEHDDHTNRGASASRNVGSRHGEGEYVAFLDADDVWLPNKLEHEVAILEARPEVAMVYGPGRWWYGWTGRVEDAERDYLQDLRLPLGVEIAWPALLLLFLEDEDAVPSASAALVRREVMERIGGSEEACCSIYDDQVLYAKIGLAAPIIATGECGYLYRQHPEQRCQVTHHGGQFHSVRLDYLDWLEGYLRRQGVEDRIVWRAVRRELRPYRHPHWDRALKRGQEFTERMEQGLRSIAGRTLPARVRRWLRGQLERSKSSP